MDDAVALICLRHAEKFSHFGLISFFSALESDSGKFLLNGGMYICLGVREFWAAGSKIWYSGSEKPIEQIKIDGKTTEPIKVHVRNE